MKPILTFLAYFVACSAAYLVALRLLDAGLDRSRAWRRARWARLRGWTRRVFQGGGSAPAPSVLPPMLHEFSFYAAAVRLRGWAGAFPCFSLPAHEPGLLEDFRVLLAELEGCRGPALPPPCSGEHSHVVDGSGVVLFALRWDCLPAVLRLTQREGGGLAAHFAGWYYFPKVDDLPDGLRLPDSCFPSLGHELANPETSQLFLPPEGFIYVWTVKNPATEESGTLHFLPSGLSHASILKWYGGLRGEAAVLEMCSWPAGSCSMHCVMTGKGCDPSPVTITRAPKAFIPADLRTPAE